MKIFVFIFFSISLFADNFILNIGEYYNFNFGDRSIITIYKTENLISKYNINDKKISLYFLKTLTANSDSENSPLAFEIKSNKHILRCIRKSKQVIEYDKSNCAIKNAINDSSFIRKQRSRFYLQCSYK